MRTIKFRGKGIKSNEFVYGDLIHGVGSKHGKMFILPITVNLAYIKNCDPLDGVEVYSETVGQFTGLYDKNGKEIFEGDGFGNKNMPNRYVVFEDGKYCFNKVHSHGADVLSQDRVGRLEIIGNIFNNPELLKN